MRVNDKRGLSGVIETVVLILLVLGAVVIIWAFVNNLISDNLEDISVSLNNVQLKIRNVGVVDTGTGLVNVQVERLTGEGNLTGIKFVFDNGDSTFTVNNYTSLGILEKRIYNLQVSDFDLALLEDVRVAPLYKSESGKEKIGNVADEYSVN